jgi:hypothetical protein
MIIKFTHLFNKNKIILMENKKELFENFASTLEKLNMKGTLEIFKKEFNSI